MAGTMETPGPLQGIKIVDVTHAWAGPTCTVVLADMGADIIKIEPFGGDSFRYMMKGSAFAHANRNKRSISLNLKKEEGQEIVLRLSRNADVFIENYLPGSMDKLGLGYEAIRHLNPSIIYCSISGYGQTGPFRTRPGYDPVMQAISGIMQAMGEPDRQPVRASVPLVDYSAGLHAAIGILASLLKREKTGKGERIDIALLDVALNQMGGHLTLYSGTGDLPKRMGSGHDAFVPYGALPTKDGLILIATTNDQMWQSVCNALGLEGLAKDPKYSTLACRRENRKELLETLGKATQKYESNELESELLAVDVPCGRIQSVGDAMKEPCVQHRQILEDVNDPQMGHVKVVKTPIFLSGKPPQNKMTAPRLGEHTSEVLKELGYSDQEIQALIEKNVALQWKHS